MSQGKMTQDKKPQAAANCRRTISLKLQATSFKLRHIASVKQNLPVREYLFNKSKKENKKCH